MFTPGFRGLLRKIVTHDQPDKVFIMFTMDEPISPNG